MTFINDIHKEFSADLNKNQASLDALEHKDNCLIIKTANKWIDEAKNRPIPNMLFSEFWYENELCILFADTNLGKSVLAVQIADSISKGVAIHGFKYESEPKKVLYLDFELSDKQLEKRCSDNYNNHYKFHHNFYRAELNRDLELPKTVKTIEEYLCQSLSQYIDDYNIEVIIVDNLTYLNSDNEKAKDALGLMKFLNKLTKNNSISILVLCHTPKRYDSKPITNNDVSGSKMLMNFCDSSFAIGRSAKDHSLRYIKQIKQRNTEHMYHAENVITCTIGQDYNFLQFEFLEFGAESEHLQNFKSNDLDQRDADMMNLIAQNKSNVEIGKVLGITEGAVRKRKKALNL
ncbi:AAA family ATPase [Winogradskyella helgolandensis]|uniref:AAA family ATPase n=1 Tax=Winogradskyella helgolandensis TaxID=2697010 RepID=UPI0015C91CAD|nr:AAA family ATPase [Winogradskyella helgolandensis]